MRGEGQLTLITINYRQHTAMMAEISATATPKRKRVEEPPAMPLKLSFDVGGETPNEGETGSPRSSVAHRFSGLELGGGGVPGDDDGRASSPEPDSMRKRQKPDEEMEDVGPSCLDSSPSGSLAAASSQGRLGGSPPSSHSAPATPTKPPRKKRTGTPPLRLKKSPKKTSPRSKNDAKDSETEEAVLDPVRAALTWHEDEITIYDPNDADDDGTGINGVGFKPSPALAHARAAKRRQQMAEYRKREESDARTMRSQRRRGEDLISGRAKKSPSRKVRFTDERKGNVIVAIR